MLEYLLCVLSNIWGCFAFLQHPFHLSSFCICSHLLMRLLIVAFMVLLFWASSFMSSTSISFSKLFTSIFWIVCQMSFYSLSLSSSKSLFFLIQNSFSCYNLSASSVSLFSSVSNYEYLICSLMISSLFLIQSNFSMFSSSVIQLSSYCSFILSSSISLPFVSSTVSLVIKLVAVSFWNLSDALTFRICSFSASNCFALYSCSERPLP